MEVVYEKYLDPTHKKYYYYNTQTGESVWDRPDGKIVDCTDGKQEQKEIEAYIAHQNKIEQEQREALEQLYPEFYTTKEEHQVITDEAEVNQFRDDQALLVHEWMQRPARRQVSELKKDTAYVEGNYDYNIWYDKYLTDRNADKNEERAISLYKCQPAIDTGFTKADKMEGKGSTYFCVYFARGCCSEGSSCRYYHRVPCDVDLLTLSDNLRDIFGRTRHATHKETFEGVGSFNKECDTLCITNIDLCPDENQHGLTTKDIVRLLYEHFSVFGAIQDIHFNTGKFAAYIKFQHRNFAEFAREAMQNQTLVDGVIEPIKIAWAVYDNPFDQTEKEIAKRDVKQAIDKELCEQRLNDQRWVQQQLQAANAKKEEMKGKKRDQKKKRKQF